jgi:hypothetical protein
MLWGMEESLMMSLYLPRSDRCIASAATALLIALLTAAQAAHAESIGLHCTSQSGDGVANLTVDLTANTVSSGTNVSGGCRSASNSYVCPAKITPTSIDWSFVINGGNYGEDDHIDRSTGFLTANEHNYFYRTEKVEHFQCQKTQGF